MKKMKKRYSELIELRTFKERYDYLRTGSVVGDVTFGGSRWLNQVLYHSKEWESVRRQVIIRDEANDLAMEGYSINGMIYVHHLNPITKQQILERDDSIFDLENLICCSFKTHNAIHYGDEKQLPQELVIRRPNDTIPWR